MTYDKSYFLAKFKRTFDDEWCVGAYTQAGAHCALGHCGCNTSRPTEESSALLRLLDFRAMDINDGEHPRYQQPTPRARILAALRDLP